MKSLENYLNEQLQVNEGTSIYDLYVVYNNGNEALDITCGAWSVESLVKKIYKEDCPADKINSRIKTLDSVRSIRGYDDFKDEFKEFLNKYGISEPSKDGKSGFDYICDSHGCKGVKVKDEVSFNKYYSMLK